jgi:RHS repeat-associated protein
MGGMIFPRNRFAEFEVNVSEPGTMYYVHADHLGSYNLITDAGKNRVDSLHFDPWGNRKQHADWTWPETRATLLFDRGFTGHEHLDAFRIINMNGRLYDPVIGRFFSPDPFVQLPNFSQNFNRYSYCLNNPLTLTDPSGYGFLSNCLVKALDVIAIPARMLTEGVCWLEDKMNGWERNGSYFDGDYLMGNAAPYNVPINPCDQLASPHYVDPLFQEFYEPKHLIIPDVDGGYYEPVWATTSAQLQMKGRYGLKNFGPMMIKSELRYRKVERYETTFSSRILDGLGGMGTGMKRMGGTFRLTNGAYNGSQVSLKHYASNWQGGSRARISTYSMAKWGSGIVCSSGFLGAAMGGVDILQGMAVDGWTFGVNTQAAIGRTAVSIEGSSVGAWIGGIVGGFFFGYGAIPGAIIGGAAGGWLGSEGGEKLILYY